MTEERGRVRCTRVRQPRHESSAQAHRQVARFFSVVASQTEGPWITRLFHGQYFLFAGVHNDHCSVAGIACADLDSVRLIGDGSNRTRPADTLNEKYATALEKNWHRDVASRIRDDTDSVLFINCNAGDV